MKQLVNYFFFFLKKRENEGSLRETLEELIEEEEVEDTSLAPDEREMLTNILKLRDLTALDLMIPRAEIIAVSHTSSWEEIKSAFNTQKVMRILVFRQTLDDI